MFYKLRVNWAKHSLQEEQEKAFAEREQDAERQRLAQEMSQIEGGGVHPTNSVCPTLEAEAELQVPDKSLPDPEVDLTKTMVKVHSDSDVYVEGRIQNMISHGETTRI